MNRALRRISIAVLVMFLLLLINVNYLQGFEPASLASKPGNSRAFYAAQNQYERGSIVTSDGVTIAASKPSSNSNDSIKYQRYYPLGPEYAPVTGYDTLYSQTGIEAAENSLLSGNDSALDVRKVIDLITGKTTKGATVEVTINSQAQAAAYDALEALGKPGGVVALDPKTGEILAMASYPSFDPNVLAIHDGTQLIKNDNAAARGQDPAAAQPGPGGDVPARLDVQDRDEFRAADPESQYHDQHQRRLADPAHAAADQPRAAPTTTARCAATGAARRR